MRGNGNKKDLSGEYGILWLTNTNEEVYFDLCNAEKICNHTWSSDKKGYPRATINGKQMRMHVFLGYKGYDHINQNKNDNRIENFRPCTIQENDRNKPKLKGCSSKYIGVCRRGEKWEAKITINYCTKYLGLYATEEEALIVRLRAEKEYFGEFAPQQKLFKVYNI